MDPNENPYRPGAGLTPPALTGRDDLIAHVKTAITLAKKGRPGKSTIPIGLRGVGKTVLLNRFTDDAKDAGAHFEYLEAGENKKFLLELGAAVRSLLLTYDRLGAASDTVKRALRIFKSFTVTLPDGVKLGVGLEPEVGFADSGLLSRDLSDLFVATGEAAAARKSCAVIAIDELQYLRQDEFEGLIMALHRAGQKNLPLVGIGTGLPQLPALTGEAKSYSERLFTFPRMGELERDAAREAIVTPARELGVKFEPEAVILVLQRTGNYPYFLQEWAYDAWNHGTDNRITAADIRAIQPNVEERLDRDFFSIRYDRLTPQERQYLRALAEHGMIARSGAIAATLGRPVESVAPLRESLIRKGMLFSPEHGETAFTVPLFDAFMKRKLPAPKGGGGDDTAPKRKMKRG